MLSKAGLVAAIGVATMPFVVSCSGNSATRFPQLKPRWQIVTQQHAGVVSGEFQMEQCGSRITGIGSDDRGHFQIAGTIDSTAGKLFLSKQYVLQDSAGKVTLDAPVYLQGKLGADESGHQDIEGTWSPASNAIAAGQWMAIEK